MIYKKRCPPCWTHAAVCLIHQSKEVCGYPLSIFFIVVNEFCERFSYYGMRGEKTASQSVDHVTIFVTMTTYFTPNHNFSLNLARL